MGAAAKKHFDTLNYVKQSKALGVQEEIAEYQARQSELAIDVAVLHAKDDIKPHDFAIKQEIQLLRKDIQQLEASAKQDTQQLAQATTQEIQLLRKDIQQLEASAKQDTQQLAQATTQETQLLRKDMQQLEKTTQQDMALLRKDMQQIKTELELKIEQVRYDGLKFTVWTGVAVTMTLMSTLGTMIMKGFHWL